MRENGRIIPWEGQDCGALVVKLTKKLGWVRQSLKRHEFFVGPSERRRIKSKMARAKAWKARKKIEVYELERELQRNGGRA